MTWLRHLRWLLAVPATVILVYFALFLLRGDREPTQAERDAQSQVDSLAQWRQAVQDSQAVLDSLAASISRVRADSARFARQVRQLRQRKDSLAGVTQQMQAVLDSIPALATDATASDSSDHWASIAFGQGHVIRTMADEITSCRQGDDMYLGRVADLEGALTKCGKRSAILEDQRDDAHTRLDRSVQIMNKMLAERQRKFLGFLPEWVPKALMVTGGVALGYAIGKGS